MYCPRNENLKLGIIRKNDTFLKKNPILGTRYREGIDFGFVYMDIMHVYPEDAGSYTLKATNALGQAVNSADLHVKSNEVIVKETMHAAAVEQISHMEQQSQISQVSTSKNPTIYNIIHGSLGRWNK